MSAFSAVEVFQFCMFPAKSELITEMCLNRHKSWNLAHGMPVAVVKVEIHQIGSAYGLVSSSSNLTVRKPVLQLVMVNW